MLAEIKDILIELTEKVNRMERKIAEMDNKISENFKLTHETNFIKVIMIFIY